MVEPEKITARENQTVQALDLNPYHPIKSSDKAEPFCPLKSTGPTKFLMIQLKHSFTTLTSKF